MTIHRVRFVDIGAHALATLGRPRAHGHPGRPPVAIDILTSTTGISFREAWSGRRTLLIDGRAIAFLGLAEFVKTKRACGRPKDLLDLELLREADLLPPEAQPAPGRTPRVRERARRKN